MRAPKPILKGSPSNIVLPETVPNPFPFATCPNIIHSPHVHFPPTPSLTSTATTHSPFMYDRAPIVVTPNTCALPERGGRKFVMSNQGGLSYFHPHAKLQANAVRDPVEMVSPTIFSASVTVGNFNECGGSLDLFMKKQRSGTMYDYDDQYSNHDQQAEHIVSSLLYDHSSDSTDFGDFYTPPPCIPPTPSSSSIPYSSRNMYDTSNATNDNDTDKLQNKKKNSLDVGRKKKGKIREYAGAEGECRTTPQVELEGCLGGF